MPAREESFPCFSITLTLSFLHFLEKYVSLRQDLNSLPKKSIPCSGRRQRVNTFQARAFFGRSSANRSEKSSLEIGSGTAVTGRDRQSPTSFSTGSLKLQYAGGLAKTIARNTSPATRLSPPGDPEIVRRSSYSKDARSSSLSVQSESCTGDFQ